MTSLAIKKYLIPLWLPALVAGLLLPLAALAQTGATVIVTPAKTAYSVGDSITVQGRNFASDDILYVIIGTNNFSLNSATNFSQTFTINQSQGFSETGSTSIVFQRKDKNNNPLSLSNSGFTVTIGSAANSSQAASSSTPGQVVNCAVPNPDPTKCLINPLPTNDLTSTLIAIMRGFLVIIGVWAVAFIVIGGFRMVMSQGQEEAYLAAKKTITWAVIGFVVAVLSFAIIAIVQNFIGVNTPTVPTSSADIQIKII